MFICICISFFVLIVLLLMFAGKKKKVVDTSVPPANTTQPTADEKPQAYITKQLLNLL